MGPEARRRIVPKRGQYTVVSNAAETQINRYLKTTTPGFQRGETDDLTVQHKVVMGVPLEGFQEVF